MLVLPYDEVPRKEGLVPLLYRAFRGSFDPWTFEEVRGQDARLRGGPAAFCAVEEGVPVGVVGVMDIPTRTMEGEEVVGGIWTVATHPAFARRGISTALTKRAHDHFSQRGVRLVFLTTMRTWVAHQFYRKLGYEEVEWTATRPMAYKVVPPALRGRTCELGPATEEGVANLFQRFTASRTGFVLRPFGFLELQTRHGPLSPALCLESESGYVLAGECQGAAEIRQLVALDAEAECALLEALEGRRPVIIDRLVTDERLLQGYRMRDYLFTRGVYGLLLVKALEPGVSVARLYGDAFYISFLEWF